VLADNRGDPLNKFLVPGDTGHSMALKRIQGAGVPRMPPLATNELDPNDIQLLTDWITQDLPQRLSFTDWQTLHFGSSGNPAADANADPDHDGQSNFLEFLAGTDPNNATSLFATPTLTTANGQLLLSFTQPANRSALIETSIDLASWTLWNVPGNTPTFPSLSQMRGMSVTLDGDHRFFRLRLSQP
jgi:hypothetical protein